MFSTLNPAQKATYGRAESWAELHLQLHGQLAEARHVDGLGELQDVVHVSDFGLLQLLADVHQLGAAFGPEGQFLQRPAGRALLRSLLVAEQLLDLVRPVDHHHCSGYEYLLSRVVGHRTMWATCRWARPHPPCAPAAACPCWPPPG